MKHKYLASTAVIALAAVGSSAAAEITFSGTARIGILTTEGGAAVTGDTTYTAIAADSTFIEAINSLAAYNSTGEGLASGTAVTMVDSAVTAITAGNVAAIDALRTRVADVAANGATSALRSDATVDLASIDGVIARLDSTVTTAVAKKSDTTVGKNRVRITFKGSGETDGGLTYGFSQRAEQSDSSSAGTQYISGAFGKITMGDIDGADEQLVGNLAGVGFSGAGSHQNFAYQSTDHNIGYSVSMAGVSFAASTDLVRGADSTKNWQ
jgi:outer membrane protein OmpU